MPRLSSLWFLSAAVVAAPSSWAAVFPGAASTVLSAGSVFAPDHVTTITTDFGAHQAVFGGAPARASVALGADSGNVPFISFSASASGAGHADLTGQVFYSWVVQGDAADNEWIPVTISTLGRIAGEVTAQALKPDVHVEASLNMMGMSIKTDFRTAVQGEPDIRGYGLEAGNRNAGGTDVFLDSFAESMGGGVTVRDSASFSETFSLAVRANVVNSIHMWVQAGTGYGVVAANADTVRYSWSVSGYIDPVITIDPTYAGRFSVVQSEIPLVAVPEASTWALLLAGLGVLAGVVRRRSTAS